MSLKTYKQKRDFSITPEPGPGKARPHKEPIFVVQEHHASRLHYDFRLEADGVLKSWAVTKEPTLDPSIKRLAVEVEDHPLAYADFSGDIPKGEYGAGHVEIWDRGTFGNLMQQKEQPMTLAEGIKAGHVEVELHGEKLKGAFALIRMKGQGEKNWLLIKMKDGDARPRRAKQKAGDGTKKSASVDSRSDSNEPKAKPAAARKGNNTPRRGTAKPPEELEFTNLDKVMFPAIGATKGDLLAFYDRIADRLLPHLIDRPMTLERLPDGLASKTSPHFWQKDTPDYYPDWIPRIDLETGEGKSVEYVLVNDRQTLLYLVNQGTITFHPWLSRIGNLDTPDYVLFDLDPGESTFENAIQVAKKLRAALKDEDIDGFVKTSGKSGLHVLAPWRKGSYDEARDWAMEIAEKMVTVLPDSVTVERSKSSRKGRLYLDVMQNVRGHHAVPPYVVRAVPAATVSTPLRWDELTADLTPGRFDINSIFRRIARQKNDPIAHLR